MDLFVDCHGAVVLDSFPAYRNNPGVVSVATDHNICIRKIHRHPVCLDHSPGHGAAATRSVKELEPESVLASMPFADEIDPSAVSAFVDVGTSLLVQALHRACRQACPPPFSHCGFVIPFGNHYEIVGVWGVEVYGRVHQGVEILLDRVLVTHCTAILPAIFLRLHRTVHVPYVDDPGVTLQGLLEVSYLELLVCVSIVMVSVAAEKEPLLERFSVLCVHPDFYASVRKNLVGPGHEGFSLSITTRFSTH